MAQTVVSSIDTGPYKPDISTVSVIRISVLAILVWFEKKVKKKCEKLEW